MSLVTVIVPVAESHRLLLPRALSSLAKQTYLPDVLVVADYQGTIDVPSGIDIIPTGGEKGSAYARNLGLDHVRTPFTFFLDADDYLLDTALETFLRAYAAYETCYVYSDWFQYKNNEYTSHKAKVYDRKRQLRRSLHLVNILVETDVAKSVYYDINYRGWEDWQFHIQLGEKGFCGTRVPEPLLIYDMGTSINREKHNGMQSEVYTEILDRYRDYLEGGREFMPCATCGGNRPQAQMAVSVMPPAPEEGMVVLEYLGQNTAPIPFRIGRVVYRGANDDAFKFIQVPTQDVETLLTKGVWRKVARAQKPAVVPTVSDFNEWRQVQPPPTPPADWASIFQRGAVAIPTETEVPKPRKKRGPNKPKPTIEVPTTIGTTAEMVESSPNPLPENVD